MKIRETGYDDYELSPEAVRTALRECRRPPSFHALMTAAEMANPDISIALAYSIAYDISYDRLVSWSDIPYGKSDFYGYRRRTLAIFCVLTDVGDAKLEQTRTSGKREDFGQLSILEMG